MRLGLDSVPSSTQERNQYHRKMPSGQPTKAAWRGKLGPLAVALLLQGGLLLLTVVVVLVTPGQPEVPALVALPPVEGALRAVQHAQALESFQRASAASWPVPVITSTALLPNAAPVMPDLPVSSAVETPTELPSWADPAATGLFADSFSGSAWADGASAASTVQFLGIEDTTDRLVIAFDVSQSVVARMDASGHGIDAVLEETSKVIESLTPGTVVNLIQFSRDYDVFSPVPVPATAFQREALKTWLRRRFVRSGSSQSGWTRETPNGVQSVLRAAWAMEPEVVILLTDGSFQRSREGLRSGENVPWAELTEDLRGWQRRLLRPARLHVIGFGVQPVHAEPLRDLVRPWGGTYREY